MPPVFWPASTDCAPRGMVFAGTTGTGAAATTTGLGVGVAGLDVGIAGGGTGGSSGL